MTDNGFKEAPARYMTSGREKVDEMRDRCHDLALAVGLDGFSDLLAGDVLFAAACVTHAMKYEGRDKGDPEGDAVKSAWWHAMNEHVMGFRSDPRHERVGFVPWTYKGE